LQTLFGAFFTINIYKALNLQLIWYPSTFIDIKDYPISYF